MLPAGSRACLRNLCWLLLAAGLIFGPGCATQFITIVADPATAHVSLAQPQFLTAVVTGTSEKSVEWSVCDGSGANCVAGGNSTVGTSVPIGFDFQGNPRAQYTAPTSLPSPPACLATTDGCAVAVKAELVAFDVACFSTLTIESGTLNPLPAITSVSPSSTTVNSGVFTEGDLTVNGSGFISSSVVRWDGSDRTTTFISDTHLSASIRDSDIAAAGTFDVTVFNPSPGGGTSNVVVFTVNNPAPAITSLSPSTAVAGGAAFTLTVNGSNFISTSVVQWDGSDRTTTFLSATQLEAAIFAADIAAAATVNVTVFNPTPGGGTSNALTFTITAAGGTGPGVVDRISEAPGGGSGNALSLDAAVTPDGRFVAFRSAASDLVSGDTNSTGDVFVRDTCRGVPGSCTPTTVLVSVASDGTQGNDLPGQDFNPGIPPALSADGRFVAFASLADNLVTGDTNGVVDVFVHDRDADNNGIFDQTCAGCRKTVRVSVASDGSQATNGTGIRFDPFDARTLSMDATGRFVVFTALGGHGLVAGDTVSGAFLHDRDTDNDGIFDEAGAISTVRVSHTNNGSPLDGFEPAISANGRFVAFKGLGHVWIRDTCFGAPGGCTPSTFQPRGNSGFTSNGSESNPAFSPNGRFLVFGSSATNFVTGDTGNHFDVFVHDRDPDENGTFDESGSVLTTLVSMDNGGVQGDNDSFQPSFSPDARFVAFRSFASNLVSGDTNGFQDIFFRDTCLGTTGGCTPSTARLSVTSDGTEGNERSELPSITADGRLVAFHTLASNLFPNDTNNHFDVLLASTGIP